MKTRLASFIIEAQTVILLAKYFFATIRIGKRDKMRFYRALSTLALMASVVVPALAREPEWIINKGEDAEDVSVGQGFLTREFGLASITSTGTDCTFRVPMTKDDAFSAEERPFFAVRYKYDSTIETAGLFFTTDELKSLSDKSFSAFKVVPDNTWRNAIVDMRSFSHKQWKGTITSFRFDPTNPSDDASKYSISRLGFFPTEAAAKAFLDAADDEPDYSLPTAVSADGIRCVIPGNSLDESFKREDFLPKGEPILGKKIDGAREEVVLVRSGANGSSVEPLCDVTSYGFATYCVREKGEFKLEKRSATGEVDFAGRASELAIRFVLARGLMSAENGKFRPEDKPTAAEKSALAAKLAEYENYGDAGQKLAAAAKQIDGKTREEIAALLPTAIRDGLGTSVDAGPSPEYFGRERIRIGAWGNFRPNDFNDDYMKTYSDCGFDFLLAMGGIPTTELLRVANKYGVEVYVNDGTYRRPLVGDAEFCDFPNYTGSFVVDEPGTDSYDQLAAVCNPYKKATGKEAYINLLPMYANAAQLKYGAGAAAIEYYDADPDLFRKYCASYCEKFDSKFICTDIYPLNWNGEHKKTTYADYVESINVIASVAREYDREFWCFIQTFAWIPSKRTPNETEFRWQCYSMLSFGCKCILCWTYAGYQDDFPSLVDTKSRKTQAWNDAKPVFWELRALSDEFVKYRNLGVFTHNCSDATPYLKMSGEYRDFDAIQEIQCDQPLLVGCFEKKDETKGAAFTLVNMSELQDEKSATVKMKLQGKVASMWRRGAPVEVKPGADGLFTFELESGDGVFVTVR